MIQNESKSHKMKQNDTMQQNDATWYKIKPWCNMMWNLIIFYLPGVGCHKCYKYRDPQQIDEEPLKWGKMTQDDTKWNKMKQNDRTWCKMIQHETK